jgi:hypothetical protein
VCWGIFLSLPLSIFFLRDSSALDHLETTLGLSINPEVDSLLALLCQNESRFEYCRNNAFQYVCTTDYKRCREEIRESKFSVLLSAVFYSVAGCILLAYVIEFASFFFNTLYTEVLFQYTIPVAVGNDEDIGPLLTREPVFNADGKKYIFLVKGPDGEILGHYDDVYSMENSYNRPLNEARLPTSEFIELNQSPVGIINCYAGGQHVGNAFRVADYLVTVTHVKDVAAFIGFTTSGYKLRLDEAEKTRTIRFKGNEIEITCLKFSNAQFARIGLKATPLRLAAPRRNDYVSTYGFNPEINKWVKSGGYIKGDSDNFMVNYTCSTIPGMSGCPVVKNRKIVGIHVGSNGDGVTNRFINIMPLAIYLGLQEARGTDNSSSSASDDDEMNRDDVQTMMKRRAGLRRLAEGGDFSADDWEGDDLKRMKYLADNDLWGLLDVDEVDDFLDELDVLVPNDEINRILRSYPRHTNESANPPNVVPDFRIGSSVESNTTFEPHPESSDELMQLFSLMSKVPTSNINLLKDLMLKASDMSESPTQRLECVQNPPDSPSQTGSEHSKKSSRKRRRKKSSNTRTSQGATTQN